MTHTESNPPVATTLNQVDTSELGPVHGVTCDASGNIWFACGEGALLCMDPESGEVVKRFDNIDAMSGTAFDGSHVWQVTTKAIVRVDPENGAVVATLPMPEGIHCSGMAYADGALWIGAYAEHRIVKIDASTGAVLKSVESDCFVTGVEWIDGELWHGAWTGDKADGERQTSLRRVDSESGAVTRELALENNWSVSGTGVDRHGHVWCGGSYNGGLRSVRLT